MGDIRHYINNDICKKKKKCKSILPMDNFYIDSHKGSNQTSKFLTWWEHFCQEFISGQICCFPVPQWTTRTEIRVPGRKMERQPILNCLSPTSWVLGEPLASAQLQVTSGLNSLTSAWSVNSLCCWLSISFKHQMCRKWSWHSVVKFLRT